MRRPSTILTVSLAALALLVGCAKKSNDTQLANSIKAQLYSDPQTQGAAVDVAVKDGVVTLSGSTSDAAHLEAYKIATNTPGVSKVNDQINVQAPEQAAQATPAPAEAPAPAPEPARTPRSRRAAHHRPTEPASASSAPAESPAPAASAPAASEPAPPPPPEPVTFNFPAGTTIEVQTVDPIDAAVNHAGDEFQATLAQPLVSGGRVAAPVGTNVYMRLVAATTSGHYQGRSDLQLRLVRMEFHGRQVPLASSTYEAAGGSRGKNTAEKVGGAAALGAIIGAIAGGGKGAAIGAGVGAAGGGVYQGATKGKQIRIPAETKLDFKLDQPLELTYTPRRSAQ